MHQLDLLFQLGKLYCDRGEFGLALQNLSLVAEDFFIQKNFSEYLKCLNLILRIHAELEEFDKICLLKEKLQQAVLKEGFELHSKTYYVLATCAGYQSHTIEALECLKKALSMALAVDDKEDISRSLLGLATIYSHPAVGRNQEALKELRSLEIFLQVYNFPEIKTAALQLEGIILSQLKKYDEALALLWNAYDTVKQTRNIVSATYILIQLCDVYFETGKIELARTYLGMAQKNIDAQNNVRLARVAQFYSDKVGLSQESNYDLVIDAKNHAVIERKLGKIDFKNQFILLELLNLFVKNQGNVYSKEYLMENIWKEAYDPSIHDNKIYVTIKRLRQLIEPDCEKPRYLFRAKGGYYMNKEIRILLEESDLK